METPVRTPPTTPRRRFGTLLSPNSPPRSENKATPAGKHSASAVAARSSRNSTSSSTTTTLPTTKKEYTVTFEAGLQRLGLQLEPFSKSSARPNTTGCRVQKFSDEGPQNPGPARTKGCIMPGDIVLKVNGHEINSYEQAIALLKQSQKTRTIVFQSVSGQAVVAATAAGTGPKGKSAITPTKSIQEKVPSTGTIWSGLLQWTTTKPVAKTESVQKETKKPPLTPKGTEAPTPSRISRSPFENMDVSLIQSPDDLVLLSQNIATPAVSQQRMNSPDNPTSPRMTLMSPNLNNSLVLPVEDMLEQDFGSLATTDEVSTTRTTVEMMRRRELQGHTGTDRSARQVESLQKEKAWLQQELHDWKAKFQTSDEMRNAQIEVWAVEKEQLLDQVQQVQQKLTRVQDEFASNKTEWERNENDLMQEIQRQQNNENEAWKVEKTHLVQEVNKHKVQNSELRSIQQEQSQKIQVHAAEIAEANNQVQVLNQQLAQRQELVDRLRVERDGALHSLHQKSQIASQLAHKLGKEKKSVTFEKDEQDSMLAKNIVELKKKLDSTTENKNTEIRSLREEREQLQASVAMLQKQNLGMQQSNGDTNLKLQDKIASLEKELGHKDSQLKEAANMMSIMGSKLSSTEEKLSTRLQVQSRSDSAMAATESRLAASTREAFELRRSLSECQAKMDVLIREKGDVQKILDDARSELSKKVTDNLSLQKSLLDAKSKVSKLETEQKAAVMASGPNKENDSKYRDSLTQELIETQNELSAANLRNSKLDNVLRSMRRNLSDAERRASSAREHLEAERRTTESLTAKLCTIEKEAQSTMEALKKNSRHLVQENEHVQEKFRQSEIRLSSSRELCEQLKIELQDAAESYTTKINKMDSDRQLLLEASSGQKKDISDLHKRLASAKAEVEESKRDLCSLRRKHDEEVRRIKEEFSEKHDQMKAVVSDKEVEMRSLNKMKDDLRISRGELAVTQHSLERSKEECLFLSKLIDEIREESSTKLQEANESHEEEMKRITETKEQTEQELSKTRSRLVAAEQEAKDATESSARKTEKISSLEDTNRSLEEKAGLLEKQLQEKMIELESLEAAGADDNVDDQYDDEYSDMSRHDLRTTCRKATTEVENLSAQLAQSEAQVKNEKKYSKEVHEQCTQLSEEIGMLSETLVRLQGQLTATNKARNEAQDDSVTKAEEIKRMADALRAKENEVNAAEDHIKRLEVERSNLRVQVDKLETSQEKNSSVLNSELSVLRTQLQESEERLQRCANDATASKGLISSLEDQLQSSKSALDEKRAENSVLEASRATLQNSVDILSQKCSDLQTELSTKVEANDDFCKALKLQVSNKDAHLEELKAKLADQSKQLEAFNLSQEELSTKISDISAERDKARTVLTQTIQEAKSHKKTIKELEHQHNALGRNNSLLTSKIEELQAGMSENEETAKSSIRRQEKQLEEIQNKVAKTTSERDQAREELKQVSEELHDLRKQAIEQNILVESLQREHANMSESLEAANSEVQKFVVEKDAALASKHETEKLLEGKTREVDQLMAKVQVLNATVTRVKTEHAMLQDSLSQNDSMAHDCYDSRDAEITRLQSKLERQEEKLSSLTEVYKSQQQVLSLSQSLEDQLLHFVDEILQSAGDSLFDMAQKLSEIDNCGKVILSKKEMLAEKGVDLETTSRMESIVSQLTSVVPKTKKMLEERHEQLCAWRKRRSLRVASSPSCATPDSKPRASSYSSPSVLEALDQMKRVLNDEILTPHKKMHPGSQSVDAQYLQKVVAALESQIDSLLSDLQSANEALKAKDQLFADLEQLVAHHENERDSLEKKFQQATSSLAEAEQKISALQNMHISDSEATNENCKLIAGRMIANFLEGRDDDVKAQVFREWSGQAVQGNGASRQTVEALSLELETMREKFMILKKHLKKSRRSKGQLQPVLARILEENAAGKDEES